MKLRKILVPLVLLAVVSLTACAQDKKAASTKEQDVAKEQLEGFLVNQPVPVFNWSQLRQNMIELQTAQAGTTATTSFFFNQGVAKPIMACPSIGFPIPSTAQLTSPDQAKSGNDGRAWTLSQIEATGVYSGDSTGTYVICVDGNGKPYAMYWEGFVSTVTGPAQWKDGQVVLTGKPTVEFTTQQK